MAGLNETPSSNRLHIGIFGKTNSGKSSFINALTGQATSIVADVAGTTTDPVYKAMEIHPLGPCVLIDTAGFNDNTVLGQKRLDKTREAASKCDIAVIVFDASTLYLDNSWDISSELEWYKALLEQNTPVLLVLNKTDLCTPSQLEECIVHISEAFNNKHTELVAISSTSLQEQDLAQVKAALTRLLPEEYGTEFITGSLVSEDDLVLLVMPQDIQAPKGRLILPQVQTIRELLDKKCLVVSVTTDKLTTVLPLLNQPPKLIITDSQVFDFVYQHKPTESMLTSFSVLFAAYKGDLPYYIEGAKAIDSLTESSRVLIAECCTHAPLTEDIGTVKIPAMLRKRIGQGLTIDHVRGTDFPDSPTDYDLIIQCGACMFNKKYVLSRIQKAKDAHIPMTNYGVTIAHVTGILDKISY